MDARFNLDLFAFEKQVEDCQALAQKAAALAVNQQAAAACVEIANRTPLGNAQRIQALTQNSWWPKKIAKELRKKNGKYTVAQAQALSEKIVAGRLARVGLERAGWAAAAADLARIPGVKIPGTIAGIEKIRRPKGSAIPARAEASPHATISNDTKGAQKKGTEAVQAGLAAAENKFASTIATAFKPLVDKYG